MNKSLSFIFIFFLQVSIGIAQVTFNNLRCEYFENPLGIDEPYPRFTWQLESEKQGVSQSAYQLIVGTIESDIVSGRGNIWESGTVDSSTIPAVYQGSGLSSFTRYFWRVRIRDYNEQWSDWSPIAFFETGMMHQTDWKGSWISDGHGLNGNSIHVKEAPYFRKEFNTNKSILSARAYIAAAGFYELYINGERIGDHQLDPMFTRYDRRNLYVTYDVTSNLQRGDNALGVILGNGWYNHQSTAVWFFDRAPWRNRPTFCMDLYITYDDGSVKTIVTGTDWKTSSGAIIFNSIYTAEHYDARLEKNGWNTPGFNDQEWKNVIHRAAPSRNITAQTLQPIRHTEEIQSVEIKKLDEYTWLFDFGRNISGVTKLKIKGPEGATIRLKHGELLGNDGRIDMSNLDEHYRPTDDTDPFQTDVFILGGRNYEEEFMARFNYKGFQYVEVSSPHPLQLSEENLTAYFMHSDVPPAGKIHTSNNTINKMWEAANASYLSNLFGYPTDCPHREKNGWTGDGHIAIEMGLYNFEAITIYEKWLADHRDEQQPNGVLPGIIPSSGWGYHWANGLDWTSSLIIIPWNIYLFYGDIRLLERSYDNIKRYLDYVEENYPSGLTDWGLGDWIPVKSRASKELTSSIYYYVDATILSKTAKLLGKEEDNKKYGALADKIKDAVNGKYLDYETGIYGSGLQTEQSMALYWELVPDEVKDKVTANLVKRVEADNKHIDVGLLGSKTILNALSENGFPQLAWEVASQESFPSWGWWIVNGATTFFENWPIEREHINSLNHIMFGEISAWFYKGLGGIFPDEQEPGFKNIILKPNFVTGLNSFEASHRGPYGTITSSWVKKGEVVEYRTTVPANSSALLHLEGKSITENLRALEDNPLIDMVESLNGRYILKLQSGNYRFEIQ